jgi:hypothetical protein
LINYYPQKYDRQNFHTIDINKSWFSINLERNLVPASPNLPHLGGGLQRIQSCRTSPGKLDAEATSPISPWENQVPKRKVAARTPTVGFYGRYIVIDPTGGCWWNGFLVEQMMSKWLDCFSKVANSEN